MRGSSTLHGVQTNRFIPRIYSSSAKQVDILHLKSLTSGTAINNERVLIEKADENVIIIAQSFRGKIVYIYETNDFH